MPHQSFMRSEPRPEAPGLAQNAAKGKGERQDHDRHADEEHEDAIVRHKEARHHGEHSAKGDAAVGHAETGGALVSGHYERVFKDYCQGRRAPPQPGERKMATAPTTWKRDRVEEQITGKMESDSPISPRLDDARTLYQNITQWQDRHEPKDGERADDQYKDMETLRAGVFDFIREMDNTLSGAEAGMTKEQSAYWRWLKQRGEQPGGMDLQRRSNSV